MGKMKKMLVVLLVACLAISLTGAAASAGDGYGFKYGGHGYGHGFKYGGHGYGYGFGHGFGHGFGYGFFDRGCDQWGGCNWWNGCDWNNRFCW